MRARRSRRAVATAAAASVLATAGIAGIVPTASAATENPYARVSITKTYDGTGHGEDTQTFITAANGYRPGDNTATDGVVSSGDAVGYAVVIEIAAGPKRTIRVSLDNPELLTWAPDMGSWGAPGTITKVTVDGDDLVIEVPAGKVETLTRYVAMRAGDTAGQVVAGQVVGVSVGANGLDPYSVARAAAVTVVSAPMADLTIRPDVNSYTASVGGQATGTFVVEPKPLNAPNSSPKGAAAAGRWRAYLDVSEFPEGTQFTVGTEPVPVTDGKLRLEASGTALVGWSLPDGWPARDAGETLEYAVHLIVDSDSFSTTGDDAMLNNATGWQPGDGEDRDVSTRDQKTGATQGISFPNNDWAAVRAHYPTSIPSGALFGLDKTVQAPRAAGATLFDPESLSFQAAGASRNLFVGRDAVAAGTELWSVMSFVRSSSPVRDDQYQGTVILADTWNAAEQHVDHTRQVSVTRKDGSVVDPSQYSVQWHADGTADPAVDSGWRNGPAPANAQALRIVLAPEAYDVRTPNDGITARVPFRVLDESSFVQSDQGLWIKDKFCVVLRHDDGDSEVLQSILGGGVLALPKEQRWTIAETVKVTDPVQAGHTATYTVVPGVADLLTSKATFNPTVTTTLDRCLLEPALAPNSPWSMSVTPAQPGPTGKVCGDPESVPIILTFTAKDMKPTSVTELDGTLPKIVFDARVSNLARAARGTTVTVASTVAGPEAIGQPTAYANFGVAGDGSTMADISTSAGHAAHAAAVLGIYGEAGEDDTALDVPAPYTQTAETVIPVELRNLGDESLSDLRVVFNGTHPVRNLTVNGYEVTDNSDGTFSLTGPDLPVGASLTGEITLEPGPVERQVRNDMTVWGRGVKSNHEVSSSDPYTATSSAPKAHLVVRHVIEDTEEDLAEPVESSDLPGAPYTTDPLTGDALVKDGYVYELAEQPQNADGTYGETDSVTGETDSETEVVYVYKLHGALSDDPDLPLPPVGGHLDTVGLVAAALAAALLLGLLLHRTVRGRRRDQGLLP